MSQTKTMKKMLTRIKLINWHYFKNETIALNGSTLITGKNTEGKSTIMDAIQMVLTTNHKRFNTAANEKGKRDIKSYVRCKIGVEGTTYFRKGSIISYVALEFHEEKSNRFFTIGAKMDSPDEDSMISIKWFCEESGLEEIEFETNGRPSMTEQFRRNGKRIPLIAGVGEAKAVFTRRLGNLEDRFIDMIPKSLAFKPMDNVKDFIYKFLLSKREIEVETLRSNIATLNDLEDLMNLTKSKIAELEGILSKNSEIVLKDREIGINDILLKRAEVELSKHTLSNLEKTKGKLKQEYLALSDEKEALESHLNAERERLTNLHVSLGSNEVSQLIKSSEASIMLYKANMASEEKSFAKLKKSIMAALHVIDCMGQTMEISISKDDILKLESPDLDAVKKSETTSAIREQFGFLNDSYTQEKIKQKDEFERNKQKIISITQLIQSIKNKKLPYPDYTVKLIDAINKEFSSRGIESQPRIFADLLEVTNPAWQNAVEGFLNTQRFNVIVDPKYFNIALDVYNQIKKEIHTVGLVNIEKLKDHVDNHINTDSLASVVKSDNPWARMYAIYLLNRVTCCEDVQDLKNYKTAITPECMLFSQYTVRKIKEEYYRVPFIGAYAFSVQLMAQEAFLEDVKLQNDNIYIRLGSVNGILANLEAYRSNPINDDDVNAPSNHRRWADLVKAEELELAKARKDQNYIEINMQIDEKTNWVNALDKKRSIAEKDCGSCLNKLDQIRKETSDSGNAMATIQAEFDKACDEDIELAELGLKKYNEQIRIKGPGVIIQNFSPRKAQLANEKTATIRDLEQLQAKYGSNYKSDMGVGCDSVQDYINEHHKLFASDIVKYEADLMKAKDNCQQEFRESFLARLKEYIDNAIQEFKDLNAALEGVYYGEDRYKFEIKASKEKEGFYKMITSDRNQPGFNLLSSMFDDEFKEEMDDMFAKLTANDDGGKKVLDEYTDYRNYLDYDIVIHKDNGSVQYFSKIYGDGSGGETQTPYYVAIVASFLQLYKAGNTIRIVMLDEAFDKMDDERIKSAMDFFTSQDLQLIIAAPPAKMEVIGENMDTILLSIRDNRNSHVAEYFL